MLRNTCVLWMGRGTREGVSQLPTQVLLVHSPETHPSCCSHCGTTVWKLPASVTLDRKEDSRLRDRSSALSLCTPATWLITRVKLYLASAKWMHLRMCYRCPSFELPRVMTSTTARLSQFQRTTPPHQHSPQTKQPHITGTISFTEIDQPRASSDQGNWSHRLPLYAPQPQLPDASLHAW